jgi:hypothetical protein
MKTRRALLQSLHAARVTLRIEGDRLRYRCPAGAMTPTLRADLAAWKPDLLHEYGERAAIMEYDGGLPRAEAEHRAEACVLAGKGEA